MKNIIIIALAIAFNDLLGAILRETGIIIAKMGALISSLPEFF
tara:strand:+ start:161 stop:289 length:129 start_codon:yes stop_codon:yes gene_type:complete